jgi:hypothetical protein
LEERRAAAALSRDVAVRAFSHLRGSPRVCPTCGRVDELVSRLRRSRQNMFGPLLRFLDLGIANDTPFDELLAVAEWPLVYLCRRYGLTPPSLPPAAPVRLTHTAA